MYTKQFGAEVYGQATILCLRNSLAACFAFASEFGLVYVRLRFPGCAHCFLNNVFVMFFNNLKQRFAAKLFLTFSEAVCYFWRSSWRSFWM